MTNYTREPLTDWRSKTVIREVHTKTQARDIINEARSRGVQRVMVNGEEQDINNLSGYPVLAGGLFAGRDYQNKPRFSRFGGVYEVLEIDGQTMHRLEVSETLPDSASIQPGSLSRHLEIEFYTKKSA